MTPPLLFLVRDARVNHWINEVKDENSSRGSGNQEKADTADERVILRADGLIHEMTHAGIAEHRFDNRCARDDAAQAERKCSNLWQNRIANRIAPENPTAA